jgi:hypothetical protein
MMASKTGNATLQPDKPAFDSDNIQIALLASRTLCMLRADWGYRKARTFGHWAC